MQCSDPCAHVSWSLAKGAMQTVRLRNHPVQGQAAVLSCECVLGREQELHARLQPLLLFFIDGASVIDLEDEDWDLLLAVQTSAGKAPVVVSAQVSFFIAHGDVSGWSSQGICCKNMCIKVF
jgi:hypothetical protein